MTRRSAFSGAFGGRVLYGNIWPGRAALKIARGIFCEKGGAAKSPGPHPGVLFPARSVCRPSGGRFLAKKRPRTSENAQLFSVQKHRRGF